MARTLIAPDGRPRVIAPTSTTKLAIRMLAASSVVAAAMPTGFSGNPAMDILLTLYVAEEDARYLAINEIEPVGALSSSVTRHWIDALKNDGLIERRETVLALSSDGHALVSAILERVYAAQRALD